MNFDFQLSSGTVGSSPVAIAVSISFVLGNEKTSSVVA